MAKTKAQKLEQLDKLRQRFDSAKSVAFASFTAVTVSQIDAIRKDLRAEQSSVQVAKKTLLEKVAAERNITVPVESYAHEVAIIFSTKDEVSASKHAAYVAKKIETWKIAGGVLEGAYISADQAIALSKLPTREQLLGQVVGTMQAPIAGFVRTLSGNLQGLVQVLKAVSETKTA